MGFGQYYSSSRKLIGYRADQQKAVCTEEKALPGTGEMTSSQQLFEKYFPTMYRRSALTFWGAGQSDKCVAAFLIC